MQEILARGGKVILITDTNGDKEIDDKNLKRLVLKNLNEFVQPIIFFITSSENSILLCRSFERYRC